MPCRFELAPLIALCVTSTVFAVVPSVAGRSAPPTRPATPSTRSAATTRPAASTGPAASLASPSVANDPKRVLCTYLVALADGNEKVVFDNLYLANEDAAKEAHAILGDAMAKMRLNSAILKVFRQISDAPTIFGTTRDQLADLMDRTPISVSGDTAWIAVSFSEPPRHYYCLTRDQGVWKVHAWKTQRMATGPFDQQKIASANARILIVNEVVPLILAGKFATYDDYRNDAVKRSATGQPATVRPALKRQTAIAGLAAIQAAIETFKKDCARYPTSSEGLDALILCPKGLESRWHGPYFETPLSDPWNQDFVYRFPGTVDKSTFDLISPGVDGLLGDDDDITRATKQ
jgi:type II secretion system protein G